MADLDSISLTTLDGRETTLAEWQGQAKLVVNVASMCGLSPQYEKLEWLQQEYGDRGFTVIGFPSNQFQQEYDSNEEIAEYCSTTWGVTFPMMDRNKVNGRDRHPLYRELVQTADAEGEAGDVQWNFEKFLVGTDGTVTRFRPQTEPDAPEVVAAIEFALPQ
jgi:glutathione peroxidase